MIFGPKVAPADNFPKASRTTFRVQLEQIARQVFQDLGCDVVPDVCLVGVRKPGDVNLPAVWIEPKTGRPPVSAFDGLHREINKITQAARAHEKQRNARVSLVNFVRATTIKRAIETVFRNFDSEAITFQSDLTMTDEYEVLVTLSFRREPYSKLPQLLRTSAGPASAQVHVTRGLPDATVWALFQEAQQRLLEPRPGVFPWTVDSAEVLRKAGRRFMSDVANRIGDGDGDFGLFDSLNAVSVLPYEGEDGHGSVILAQPGHAGVSPVIQFREPISISNARWARKVIQMASRELCARSDGGRLTGLSRVSHNCDHRGENLFVVDFKGLHRWNLRHANRTLLEIRHGVPHVPRDPINPVRFKQNLASLIRGADLDTVWAVVDAAAQQRHGTMIVISERAADEAARLTNQGTPIEPLQLTDEVVGRITGIDGAVILDPAGACHAVGVILDGLACSEGTPSRGARYNSALRYVAGCRAKQIPTLAVIVSEDGYIDVHPTLPPPVPRA